MALGITIRRKAAQLLRNRLMTYRDLPGDLLNGESGDRHMTNILVSATALARAQGLSRDHIRETVEAVITGRGFSI